MAFPVIGWQHEMAKLSREDALPFYSRYYAPNNAILVVAGDVKADEVIKLAERRTARFKPTPTSRPASARRSRRDRGAPVELKDARAAKATFRRYYLAPSYTDRQAARGRSHRTAAAILAVGHTGASTRSWSSRSKAASTAGGWFSGTGLDSGAISLYAVPATAWASPRSKPPWTRSSPRFRKTASPQAELDRAKKTSIADIVYEADNQTNLARTYGWASRSAGRIEAAKSRKPTMAVTLDDIKQAAAHLSGRPPLRYRISAAGRPKQVAAGNKKKVHPRSAGDHPLRQDMLYPISRQRRLLLRRRRCRSCWRALCRYRTVFSAPAQAMKIQKVVSRQASKPGWSRSTPSRCSPCSSLSRAVRPGPRRQGRHANFLRACSTRAPATSRAPVPGKTRRARHRICFEASRDAFNGGLETLTRNKDEAFRLLRLALTQPRMDEDAVERVREQLSPSSHGDEDPEKISSNAWFKRVFDGHPYANPSKGTLTRRIADAGRSEGLRKNIFAREQLKISAVGDISAAELGKAARRGIRRPAAEGRAQGRAASGTGRRQPASRSSSSPCRSRWPPSASPA